MGKLYDIDIVAWSCEQAELLRGRYWDALDLERIAEEIEDVGRSETGAGQSGSGADLPPVEMEVSTSAT